MPERSQKSEITFECVAKLKSLENYKYYASFKHGDIRNELARPQRKLKWIKEFKIKNMDLSLSVPGEWENQGMESSQDDEMLRQLFEKHTQLQKLSIKAIKTFTNYENLIGFMTAISAAKTLRHFGFEFLNCKIEDMHVIAFVHCITKMKQLHSFSLKVLQNPNISEECLERVTSVLLKLENLSRFDLYFRRLNLAPQEILELGNRIQNLFGNVECACSRGSIHIYKTNNRTQKEMLNFGFGFGFENVSQF